LSATKKLNSNVANVFSRDKFIFAIIFGIKMDDKEVTLPFRSAPRDHMRNGFLSLEAEMSEKHPVSKTQVIALFISSSCNSC